MGQIKNIKLHIVTDIKIGIEIIINTVICIVVLCPPSSSSGSSSYQAKAVVLREN